MTRLQKRPVVVIVRDGWGENPFPQWDHANAVKLAKKPTDDRLRATYPWTLIKTSGLDVGLPVGVMGNSEVGHQNIGAGRIVDQEIVRISKLFDDQAMDTNPAIKAAVQRVTTTSGRLHLMGLASEAGVHSSLEHLYGLLRLLKRAGVAPEKVFIHNFGDGRDSTPHSGIDFCREIEEQIATIGIGRIASVIGRYYAMDRDHRWDRVEKAYRLLVDGTGHRAKTATEAYQRYYDHPTEASRQGDEFIEATAIVDASDQPIGPIKNGDAVIFYNFRGDRPRELCKAFCNDPFPYVVTEKDGPSTTHGFQRGPKLDLCFVAMTEYEKGLPVSVAVKKPPKMEAILGMHISALGLKQFRCAETEKFPHVTFFFNDYREEPFPGEDRQIIPSPRDVSTYDQKPEMSAPAVTQEMLRRIESAQYDLMILNFANGDMVGHTGSLPAAIKAVETVDHAVGLIVDAVLKRGGALIVTADHGNCEQMIHPETGGPHTAHTTYDVPLIVVDDRYTGVQLRKDGRLADIAPTALHLLGLELPEAMTGKSLIGS